MGALHCTEPAAEAERLQRIWAHVPEVQAV
jgi:hypothetical protein